MKVRPLLVASALFCSTNVIAGPATPPLDTCTVAGNTKAPMMDGCESVIANAEAAQQEDEVAAPEEVETPEETEETTAEREEDTEVETTEEPSEEV